MERWDKIIIGAGLYGLYAALSAGRRGERVLVLEGEDGPFRRATYINQARVHMGYHYPRSYSTAVKSAGYFDRFVRDFGFCIHSRFDQVYATSAAFSWTDGEQFRRFCRTADIRCDPVPAGRYFNDGMCDGAFLTQEYTYDAHILRDWFLEQLKDCPRVVLRWGTPATGLERAGSVYRVTAGQGERFESDFVLNATYAAANQIIRQALPGEEFPIKYELCEIILCTVDEPLKDVGITVMDGPFFSIMPFGKTGLHSLTSVTFTPHMASFDALPTFPCQGRSVGHCSPERLGGCDDCPARPETAWSYMSSLARKYLRPEFGFRYQGSLFSMKPILKASEIDDSRPTVIRVHSRAPALVSVLSGKINTVYDLDGVLKGEF